MSERQTFTDPLFRCGCCRSVSNQEEIQLDLGRCPVCGSSDLTPAGAMRVTYEALGNPRGGAGTWRLLTPIPQPADPR